MGWRSPNREACPLAGGAIGATRREIPPRKARGRIRRPPGRGDRILCRRLALADAGPREVEGTRGRPALLRGPDVGGLRPRPRICAGSGRRIRPPRRRGDPPYWRSVARTAFWEWRRFAACR